MDWNTLVPEFFLRKNNHCRLLLVPEGYNKLLVPPPTKGKSKLEVTMSVKVTKILRIDVVRGFFETRFVLERRWLDSKLSYQNLDADNRLNLIDSLVLEEDQAESAWFPVLEFINMASSEDWSYFKWNQQYYIERNPDNHFVPSDVTTIDNAYIYSGKENKHFISPLGVPL